ncbi:hypothetical protein EMCRGX_G005086 [Ephydatia muelleri]
MSGGISTTWWSNSGQELCYLERQTKLQITTAKERCHRATRGICDILCGATLAEMDRFPSSTSISGSTLASRIVLLRRPCVEAGIMLYMCWLWLQLYADLRLHKVNKLSDQEALEQVEEERKGGEEGEII